MDEDLSPFFEIFRLLCIKKYLQLVTENDTQRSKKAPILLHSDFLSPVYENFSYRVKFFFYFVLKFFIHSDFCKTAKITLPERLSLLPDRQVEKLSTLRNAKAIIT